MKIEKLVFSAPGFNGDTSLEIVPKRIVLFIGPNNGGKSRALLEIQDALNPVTNFESVVFRSVDRSDISLQEIDDKLNKIKREKRAGEDSSPNTIAIEGKVGRQLVHLSVLQQGGPSTSAFQNRQYLGNVFLRYFYINLGGEGRLALANAVQAEPVGTPPKNTISALLQNNLVRHELSQIVFKAFNEYLVIDPTQMPNLQYKLSRDRPEGNIEKRFDEDAAAYFKKAMALRARSESY